MGSFQEMQNDPIFLTSRDKHVIRQGKLHRSLVLVFTNTMYLVLTDSR